MKEFLTNPLIVKEMRERFRTKKTVWILGLYLFVMGALLLGFLYIQQMNNVISPGDSRELFILMAIVQYAMICFIAPALSAGAISGERERQTLNILLTTQLDPNKIIASKILTSLAFIFLLVIASFPLYSFVFLYGGISPTQLITLMVFFGVNIVFFGSLGLLCSTWLKRTQVSTITSYGISFFIVVGTGLLYIFITELLRQLNPLTFTYEAIVELLPMKVLGALNPVIAMFDILGEDMGPTIDLFMPLWVFFTAVYGIGSLLLIAWSGYLLRPVRGSWKFWQ